MSDTFEYGEPVLYEITWKLGHVDHIPAHQVSWSNSSIHAFALGFDNAIGDGTCRRVQFHAEIDDRWTLQLSALEDDIRTIRNMATERIPGPDGAL